MDHKKVDPAALLVAVLAVGITPFTEAGPWHPLNTIIAAVVLVVVSAFTLTEAPRHSTKGFLPSSAIGLVIGLIIGVGSAWPAQLVMRVRGGLFPPSLEESQLRIKPATSAYSLVLFSP